MPVFDQGYQHWSGTLSGHAWRWLAITRHGIRVALGNRWLKLALFVAWLPAIALAAVVCFWGLLEQQSALIQSLLPMLGFLDREMLLDPRAYRMEVWTLSYGYFMLTELRLAMVLILLVGPNLISQDLRYNALPLYLSRPLRRIDYFLGKWGVIVSFVGAVTVLPAIAAYVLGILFSLDVAIIKQTFPLLLASVCYGLIIAGSAGTLILALSALSRSSRYVAMFWLAVWIGSGVVSGVLLGIEHEARRHASRRLERGGSGGVTAPDVESTRADWRPLVSYTANLARVGEEMLGTPEAWDKLAKLRPGAERDMTRPRTSSAPTPWTWSAGVLAALFGLSVWILHRSVKSLDRLK
ncbi:ABC transporter permease [Lacipirellula limnantheis]|uniref:ABC-2 family transporter protein n=1 Tax=Lacipirellula limnantheis TaxID=2528024 RepID=A0A517TZ76_9BACT|nr:ABC transporter permease subunit [Lacipirellula limnantheis]QDT73671.1 ABC-2 family transporter protein [Lacipirellula limnantheis]